MTRVTMAAGIDGNEGQAPDLTTFWLALNDECWALRTTHPNVLVVGPDAVVEQALRTLQNVYRLPVTTHEKRDALPLSSPSNGGTLILRDVGTLSLHEQNRLMAWMEDPCGHTQVIATNARALYPCLDTGAFLKDLYYRLNVVYFDCSEFHATR
jgi:hypothetical protein